MKTANTILWIARIWGTLILAFVLFFLLAGLFGEQSGGELRNAREVITFIMFPIGPIVGLALAWKWEGLGGLIATVGMLGLFVLRPDLLASAWFPLGIAPPGILYLVYWHLSRPTAKSATPSG